MAFAQIQLIEGTFMLMLLVLLRWAIVLLAMKWLLHDYDLPAGGLCRLECEADQVKSVYMSASTLKMHRATEACSQFLADNLTLQNCLSE